jgi:LPXTG-site transpeptidase (sortase) family protein
MHTYGYYIEKRKNIRNKILKSGLLAVVLVGCSVLVLQSIHKFPVGATPDVMVKTKEKIRTPARIQIPVLKLDAAIEQVGIASDGSMDVPRLPFDTAWYKLGPRPGEIGSAVIDGHVDWKDGTKAVFSDLHSLRPGDKIVVQDSQGTATTFIVQGSRTYASNADASEIFTSKDAKAHLNLITCQGVWDKSTKSYTQRLVVFSDKE